jgi:hypothetical protein
LTFLLTIYLCVCIHLFIYNKYELYFRARFYTLVVNGSTHSTRVNRVNCNSANHSVYLTRRSAILHLVHTMNPTKHQINHVAFMITKTYPFLADKIDSGTVSSRVELNWCSVINALLFKYLYMTCTEKYSSCTGTHVKTLYSTIHFVCFDCQLLTIKHTVVFLCTVFVQAEPGWPG